MKKSRLFAKLKEVFIQPTTRHKNTTFNFARPHPKLAFRQADCARKLGIIIWAMITQKVAYKPPTEYLFLDQKRKLKLVDRMKRNIAKFDIKTKDVCFVTI